MTKNNKFKSILFFIVIVSFFIFLPTQNTYAFIGGALDILGDLASGASNAFIGGFIGFFALIAGVIIEFIIGFGNLILKFAIDGMGDPTGSGVVVVEEGWKIVRNLANSALIIGLVFIAINIILGKEEGTAKKTLVNFVIVALLINFTPLICGFIIEGSQIIALSFIGTGLDINSANRILAVMENMKESVENPLWLIPGLFSLFVFALLYFAVCILYSILFMVRTVILWILIITSPIALATKVFPKSDIVMKFFPSILYWDEWYKTFLQWVIIIIPAGLFLHLSNLSMQSIISSPVSYVGATGAVAIIQITFAAVSSYLTPIIILLVGFMITISSGGQVAAPIGTFANKAKTFATGYAKEAGKGIAGGYLEQRKSGKTRLESLRGLNFENRESGRAYFDDKIDSAKGTLGFKNYETRRKEDGAKKDFDSEGDTIKDIEKDFDKRIKAETDPIKKSSLKNQKEREIQLVTEKSLGGIEKEIRIAETKGDKERVKDLKKKMALFLQNHNKKLLEKFEKDHDINIEDIIKKMSGADITKNLSATSLKDERITSVLSSSQISYIMERGSPKHQDAMMEGAASINLNQYTKGTKEYNDALKTKSEVYSKINQRTRNQEAEIAGGGARLDDRRTDILSRGREIAATYNRIRIPPRLLTEKEKNDMKRLREEAKILAKELRGLNDSRSHY